MPTELSELPVGAIWSIAGAGIVTILALLWFCYSLWKYGPEIKKLNTTESIGKLFMLSDNMWDSAKTFSEASRSYKETYQELKSVKSELADFGKQQTVLVAKIEVAQATLARALEELIMLREAEQARKAQERAAEQIAEERSASIVSRVEAEHPGYSHPAPDYAPLAQELMPRIKAKWDKFSTVFRRLVEERNNLAWDGRAIGQLAYQLTDGRRSRPISQELADRIAELHGEYRSFVLKQNSDDGWLTPSLVERFESKVDNAIGLVKQVLLG